jgi:hypothetical protein
VASGFRPSRAALSRAVAHVEEARPATAIYHALKTVGILVSVGVGNEPRIGTEVGGIEPSRDGQDCRIYLERNIYVLW